MPDEAATDEERLARAKAVIRDHGIAPEPLEHESLTAWQHRLWEELECHHGKHAAAPPTQADALLFLLADVLQRKQYWN